MKKVIRLNENDVERLVKKIIRENDDQLEMEFPEDGNGSEEDYDQTAYNIGNIAADELMDLVINAEDESIVWSFVKGFTENADPSVVNLIIDSFTNRGDENVQESYRLNKNISKKRKFPRGK